MFLISAIISMVYASIMSAYAAYHVWPPLNSWQVRLLNGAVGQKLLLKMLREIFLAFGSSMLFLPARGLVLVYLFIASVSIEIGLSVLLWQQLCFIYEGKTYLSHISAAGGDSTAVKDCQNFIRFFGCPYYTTTRLLPSFFSSKKRHKKWSFKEVNQLLLVCSPCINIEYIGLFIDFLRAISVQEVLNSPKYWFSLWYLVGKLSHFYKLKFFLDHVLI